MIYYLKITFLGDLEKFDSQKIGLQQIGQWSIKY